MLEQLPCALIVDALQSFALASPRYLLLSSYVEGNNMRVEAGDFFPLDLRLLPFSLADKVQRVYEEAINEENGMEQHKLLVLIEGKYLDGIDFYTMKKGCSLLPYFNSNSPALVS